MLGINGIGQESSNGLITTGRKLPWLQDVAEQAAWTAWGVEYRDVIILDAAGARRSVFNLTTRDLGDPSHRAALKQQLLDAR